MCIRIRAYQERETHPDAHPNMQREEALEGRKLGELQAILDGMKIKDVALKANKSTKQPSTSKSKSNKEALASKAKAPKKIKEEVETSSSSSSSSESESDGEQYEEINDMALFMRKYRKGLKKEGYKVVKRMFPKKKKINMLQLWEHQILHCSLSL
jgi:spore germination protein YaaH